MTELRSYKQLCPTLHLHSRVADMSTDVLIVILYSMSSVWYLIRCTHCDPLYDDCNQCACGVLFDVISIWYLIRCNHCDPLFDVISVISEFYSFSFHEVIVSLRIITSH